ncbi:uncharacterized protein [Physcomitrium patens]|uniref:CCDC113/CCDC96 coiled-coil domain-containing protein n=1 Tax=Physcomitrium patens TaxID=3218 RepID=A0A7I4FIF0_PHYPA|nr:vicilin-like seed storage protein At2g18540 isoform X2 [Physcomitrium patens]XP_024365422.1 vicilin-like seed storage protein At2g18540 isoform X2 [Physcomitrium patens]XP_024365423.1 vicilin-like seed storage protein At2g18540 isoform X2 [Physcomitrium patens]|eukprot:XP_024365421.1 vicilin-like seed storage protein At2g18540 isoform X2 [Physcomitrella patens]
MAEPPEKDKVKDKPQQEGPEEVARRESEQKRLEEEQQQKKEAEQKRLEEEQEQRKEEQSRREEAEARRLEEKRRKEEQDNVKRVEAARLRFIIETTQEEVNGLKQENVELQKRVCSLQKKRRSVNAEGLILEGQEAYYQARMRDWAEMKLGFKTLKEDYDSKIEELRGSLQKKKAEADARQEGLIHFLWKIARHSRDVLSNQRIPRSTLLAVEQEERDSILEKQIVRIRGRQLKNQLAKLEHKLELKDQLQSENGPLHLVNYEQLKMENESFNAKISLKNEALTILRKKTRFLVHLLTHVREKLQFLFEECKEKRDLLLGEDQTLYGSRVKLSKIKASIVAMKRKMEASQKKIVIVTIPKLLDDMDFLREDIDAEEKVVNNLKKQYQDLNFRIEERKKKLFSLGEAPVPAKKFSKNSIERGALRWGVRRGVFGQNMDTDMEEMMADQMTLKPPLCKP